MNLRQFVMSAPRRSASIPALSNQVRNTRNLWPITAPHRSRKLSSVSESSSVSTKSRWKEALYKISIYKCNLLSEFACFLLKLVLIVFLLLLLRHLLLVLLFFYFCFLWLCVFLLSFFLLFLLSLLPPNPPPPPCADSWPDLWEAGREQNGSSSRLRLALRPLPRGSGTDTCSNKAGCSMDAEAAQWPEGDKTSTETGLIVSELKTKNHKQTPDPP